MNNKVLLFCTVACGVLLVGCGSATIPVKPEALEPLRSIAVIRVAEPTQYTMFDRGSGAAAFGAVGGVIMAADAERNAKSVGGAMLREKFAFGLQLTEDLERRLKAAGYKTTTMQYNRESPVKPLDDYSRVPSAGADAILDVTVQAAGYSTENWALSPHWRPEAWVQVVLYAPKLKEIIYREKILYGYHNPFISATELDAPSQFHFKNKEALLAAGDQVLVNGLKDASQSVASHIGNQLKK